jgi:RHS repeat-associated protein
VFFDNLQVTQVRGPLVEETHYYPMGLPMTGICSRVLTGVAANKMKYQGQEHEEALGLNLYEFEARQYDPQLGRWHVPDPANQFANPYLGMGNTWPNVTDPDGRALPVVAAAIIAAVIKGAVAASVTYVGMNFVAGGTWKDLNFKDWSKAALIGAATNVASLGFAAIGGPIANSIGYGMATKMATNAGISVAFGEEITWGSVVSSAVAGAIDGAVPQFKGFSHKGSFGIGNFIANGIGELVINTFRGAVTGSISGMLTSVIDGNDVADGFYRGFRNGAISSALNTGANMLIMGTPIRPNGAAKEKLEKMGADLKVNLLSGPAAPVYRTGGLWPRGLTVGLSVGMGTSKTGGTYKDGSSVIQTWIHEAFHHYQKLNQTWAGQMGRGMWEQWIHGKTAYDGDGTYNYDDYSNDVPNEVAADRYWIHFRDKVDK